MWVGFGLALVVGSLKGLHHYYPSVPAVSMSTSLGILRDTVNLPIMLSFSAVGIFFFVNLDIALGLWVFTLLAMLEKGIFSVVGLHSTEVVSVYGTPESPLLAHQGIGALLAYVVVGLWQARSHFATVGRQAWKGQGDEDAGEIMSYRAAVLGLSGGIAVMVLWLWSSGIPLLPLLVFLAVALLIFFGLSRIVVEGGVAAARSPMIASTFAVSGLGTSIVGAEGLVALAYTYIWHGDVRTFVMASCANGLKIVEGITNLRPLFWALALAILVTLAGSIATIIYLAYTYGGINLHGWFFGAGPQAPFNYIAHKFQNAPPVQVDGWLFKAIGATLMGGLLWLRHHFLWWPFHPLGFAICTVSFIVGRLWFSVFLAWLFKVVVLKYGGSRLHRMVRPFFMGLILGQFSNAGFWLIVDGFTGTTGNGIGVLFW